MHAHERVCMCMHMHMHMRVHCNVCVRGTIGVHTRVSMSLAGSSLVYQTN